MEFYEKVNRIAKTEKGEIEGIPGNIPQYTVFKGIPYAKAPVGELRWREPQETEKWEGVYHADHFGPIAPQMRHPKGSLYGDEFFQSAEDMSEDCLYLNIWTPEVKEEKKLLEDPRANIKDVSRSVGYSDSKYFSKIFKRITGQLPSEYRDGLTS